jgi:carbon monoxide dehydrogenase subunit G
MEFTQRIGVDATPEKVWALLWDIKRMASCIPGCREATEVEAHKRYTAVVGERVGPFKVTFPLDIEILEAVEGRRLRAAASGKDSAIGSSMKMALDLSIAEDGDQTILDIKTDVAILGKLGALGHSMIKRKADDMMGKFAQALKAEVEKP